MQWDHKKPDHKSITATSVSKNGQENELFNDNDQVNIMSTIPIFVYLYARTQIKTTPSHWSDQPRS